MISYTCWDFVSHILIYINNANRSASITEAFIPDLSSPSFQKPEKDINIASGFLKFARQFVLQDNQFTQGNIICTKMSSRSHWTYILYNKVLLLCIYPTSVIYRVYNSCMYCTVKFLISYVSLIK